MIINVLPVNDCPDDKFLNKYVRGKVCAAGANKWRDLGIALMGQKATTDLDVIRVDHPNDVKACCSRMFTEWRQTTLEASWKLLIEALEEVKLTELANELKELLLDRPSEKKSEGIVCLCLMFGQLCDIVGSGVPKANLNPFFLN